MISLVFCYLCFEFTYKLLGILLTLYLISFIDEKLKKKKNR